MQLGCIGGIMRPQMSLMANSTYNWNSVHGKVSHGPGIAIPTEIACQKIVSNGPGIQLV